MSTKNILTINIPEKSNLSAKFEEKYSYNTKSCSNDLAESDINNTVSISDQDGEVIKVDKPLFKKTLSRLVVMQIVCLMLEDVQYSKTIGTGYFNNIFQEMCDLVVENNKNEWGYFRGKQLAKNFIKEVTLFINNNIRRIESLTKKSNQVFQQNTVIKALVYSALGEYLMRTENEKQIVDNESIVSGESSKIEGGRSNKDYRSIIVNEYVEISEYFLDSNEITLFNGMINNVINDINCCVTSSINS